MLPGYIRVEKAVSEDLCEEDFHAVIGEFGKSMPSALSLAISDTGVPSIHSMVSTSLVQ